MNAKYANNRKFNIFTNYSSIDYDINIICENLRSKTLLIQTLY